MSRVRVEWNEFRSAYIDRDAFLRTYGDNFQSWREDQEIVDEPIDDSMIEEFAQDYFFDNSDELESLRGQEVEDRYEVTIDVR